jgi:hypothetical protein
MGARGRVQGQRPAQNEIARARQWIASYEFSMGEKGLELLKEIAPGVRRAALVFNPDAAPFAGPILRAAGDAARSLPIEPIEAPAHDLAGRANAEEYRRPAGMRRR